jgi:hypothetical protein
MPTDENTGTRDAYITYNSKISSSLALIVTLILFSQLIEPP